MPLSSGSQTKLGHYQAAWRTKPARARMNAGESFNPSVISNLRMPKENASSRASSAISCRVSMWSETKEMGTTRTLRTPRRPRWCSAAV